MRRILFIDDMNVEANNDESKVDANNIAIDFGESYYRIKSIMPILIEESETNDHILNFLCINETDNMFILSTVFQSDKENLDFDSEYFRYISIHESTTFASQTIAFKTIKKSFTNYITDFVFEYDGDKLNSDIKEFNFKAYNMNNGEAKRFIVNTDTYASISYQLNYIMGYDYNLRTLSLASLVGVDKEDDRLNSEIIMVKSIDNIVKLARVDKYGNIAIVFDCTDDKDDSYTLLTSFNLGYNIKKRKTKGVTVAKIESTFLSESDQYINSFSFDSSFDGKSYITIRAVNNEKKSKIFFINNSCQEKIIELINDR
jgi:hypothetical protein